MKLSEFLLTSFFKAISLIPVKIQLILGKYIGLLLFRYVKKRKAVAIWNLTKCFPMLNKEEVNKTARENFVRLGQSFFELCNSYYRSEKSLKKLVSNLDQIENEFNKIKYEKVLLLIPHTATSVDWVVRVPCFFMKLNGMHRPQDSSMMDKIITKGRSRFVDKIFEPNQGKLLLQTLDDGESVLYAPDQDYGYKNSIFVDFFNHKALTVVFPSVLVERTNCKAYLFTLTKNNDATYKAGLRKLDLSGDNIEDDLSTINKSIEEFATEYKSEYFWIHRRFKNRPEGESSFYPDEALRDNWL